jgi:hypothetical protein
MGTILDKRHGDWPWPFSLIPRRWTAFDWRKPELVRGNLRPQDYVYTWQLDVLAPGEYKARRIFAPKPITGPQTWQISRFPRGPWWAWYFAWSGERKEDGWFRHFRIGARWDDVDNYVQFPSVAWRRYSGDDSQNTEV